MSQRLFRHLLVLAMLIASVAPYAAAQEAPDVGPHSFHSNPVMFIENMGQWSASTGSELALSATKGQAPRFQVWGGPMGAMWLAEDAMWITIVERSTGDRARSRIDTQELLDLEREDGKRDELPRQAVSIKLSFVDANPHPRIESFDRLDTVVSYFIGNDPDQWRPDVPVWGGVRYVDLYPGVDLEVTGEGGRMVQRLAARPGADLAAVQLRVEGADAVAADGDALRLTTAAGEYVLPLFRATGLQVTGLNVQPSGVQVFDVNAPLAVPDVNPQSAIASPQSVTDNAADLLYGGFLGGSDTEFDEGIAVDGAGSAYVTGSTGSSDFPTTPGAFSRSYNGVTDVFVAKLNSVGNELVYVTFLGGSDQDDGSDIAVDGAGSAYVTGDTHSSNFPTTSGAFDTSYNAGLHDAFVAKLNPTGSGLAYATFLGGSGSDAGRGIAVDSAGSAYVTGYTVSSDLPTTSGAFDTSYNAGYSDAFIAKLNPTGSGLAYATFLGGSGSDAGQDIAVDSAGSAYVTGGTQSSDFPTTAGAFDRSHNGRPDAFAAKLNSAGSGLAYATFLGGIGTDYGYGIAVDGTGSAYVTGDTYSSDFPTTAGAFDTSHNGGSEDAFAVKLSPAGSGLAYATFLGGSATDRSFAIAVDGAGNAYVTGYTESSDFPTTPGAFDTSYNAGLHDAFVAKLDPAGSGLTYATFLGSGSEDWGRGIAVDGAGSAYMTGWTYSGDFPTTPGAFDTSFNGGDCDGFVAKLAMGGEATYAISGHVTYAGSPLSGASVSDGAGHSVTSDNAGAYTLTGLAAGTYTLTASKSGHSFTPSSRTVTVPPDATGQDFVGTPLQHITFLPSVLRGP